MLLKLFEQFQVLVGITATFALMHFANNTVIASRESGVAIPANNHWIASEAYASSQ